MNSVINYISEFEGEQKAILFFLHELMMEIPEVTSKLSYGVPFYYRKSWICYLSPGKRGEVEFAFTRGNELSNSNGLLESKNRKQVMSVTFKQLNEIQVESLLEVIQEAILLDEKVPYASKRK